MSEKTNESKRTYEIIKTAVKIPGIRIDRNTFLKKELMNRFPKPVVR